MSRGRRFAVLTALTCVGAAVVIAVGAPAEPEPRPTPPRVYSSCLAADTQPMSPGDDQCDGG